MARRRDELEDLRREGRRRTNKPDRTLTEDDARRRLEEVKSYDEWLADDATLFKLASQEVNPLYLAEPLGGDTILDELGDITSVRPGDPAFLDHSERDDARQEKRERDHRARIVRSWLSGDPEAAEGAKARYERYVKTEAADLARDAKGAADPKVSAVIDDGIARLAGKAPEFVDAFTEAGAVMAGGATDVKVGKDGEFDAAGTASGAFNARPGINMRGINEFLDLEPDWRSLIVAAGEDPNLVPRADKARPQIGRRELLRRYKVEILGENEVDAITGERQRPDSIQWVSRTPRHGDRKYGRHGSAFNDDGGMGDAREFIGFRDRLSGPQMVGGGSFDVPLRKALRYLSKLDRTQLVNLQKHLVLAGFYGDEEVAANAIGWGISSDPATVNAWRNATIEADRNKQLSLPELIQQRQIAFAPRINELLSGGTASGRTIQQTIEDEDTIRERAEEIWRESIGRKPTEAELGNAVALIREAERRQGGQMMAAANSADLRPGRGPVEPQSLSSIRLSLGGGPEFSKDNVDRVLYAIMQHESGGDPTAQNNSSSASGLFQFIDGTWHGLADPLGYGQYAHAKDAPEVVQWIVARHHANRILGATQDWRAIPAVWYVGGRGYNPSSWGEGVPSEGENSVRVSDYVSYVMEHAFGAGSLDIGIGPGSASPLDALSEAGNRLAQIENVDTAASLAQDLKKTNPVEYEAQAIGSAYGDLMEFLGGNSGIRR